MLQVVEASSPIEYETHWTQEAVLRDATGIVAVRGYYPAEPSPYFYEQPGTVARAAVLCPGFGESMDHPTLAAMAAGFAGKAGLFAVTLDPRGFHKSAHPGKPCKPGQVAEDIAGIATLIGPTERLVLGGQSMGGSMAAQAAVQLGEQRVPVRTSHIVALKTPAKPADHRPFGGFQERARKGRPFFGVDAEGRIVRQRVEVGPEVFDYHSKHAELGPLLAALAIRDVPPKVLLKSSSGDGEIDRGPLQELAAEYRHVTYREGEGRHSDYSPEVAQRTAAAIVAWYNS